MLAHSGHAFVSARTSDRIRAHGVPIKTSRRLTGSIRSADSNRHLGFTLAFVAGAVNAGGFLAIHQYTSHMTGIVSSMAGNLVMGAHQAVFAGAGALFSFVAGAGTSAMLVLFARQRRMHSEYALPLIVEAALLLLFGLVGARSAHVDGQFVPLTVMLLAFMMGLQNALISKLSDAEIRTTHVTGIVTDIGIELGKRLYSSARSTDSLHPAAAGGQKLRLLCALAGWFFLGGIAGAIGFNELGYPAAVPLALALLGLASAPVLDDLQADRRK